MSVPAAGAITAVITDFGGVLTSPLIEAFTAAQERVGVPLEALGQAMATIAERDGVNPLFELERGRMTEAAFHRRLSEQLTDQLGRKVEMDDFGRQLFEGLEPNERFIEYLRELRGRGYRLAICTNNVREWESQWRAMLPIDELFDAVVDSGFVGFRKPEREIYDLTLERLGVGPEAALMIDDIDINCDAARALGMTAVQFHCTEQAIADIEAALRGAGKPGGLD